MSLVRKRLNQYTSENRETANEGMRSSHIELWENRDATRIALNNAHILYICFEMARW